MKIEVIYKYGELRDFSKPAFYKACQAILGPMKHLKPHTGRLSQTILTIKLSFFSRSITV